MIISDSVGRIEVQDPPPYVKALARLHHPDPSIVHTNLEVEQCACYSPMKAAVVARPNLDGPSCPRCGSVMVPTGSCHTCMVCGESGGCG